MEKLFTVGSLNVMQFNSRREMGARAAKDAVKAIQEIASNKDEVNIIFAAPPSQNEFLTELRAQQNVPWEKVNAFQMDDYIGIDEQAPQRFANFLKKAIFDHVPLRSCELISCSADPKEEMERYAMQLRSHPIDIAFIGIGENGHIAFNDPEVADFFDHEEINRIRMAEESRIQQVNDGCFASLGDVPHEALTVTIPTILRARRVLCVVPYRTKANAVRNALTNPISTDCPASVLRLHKNATLYIDDEAASKLAF